MSDIPNEYKLIYENRIDIVIGIEYVDFYENKYNTNFFVDLYIEHKRAFNGLREGTCVGEDQHLQRFNGLIDSIREKKTNTEAIPVCKYNDEFWVRNGFHRTSILSYYNLRKKIRIEPRQKLIEWYYPTNIYFFKERKYDVKYCHYTMSCFLKKYSRDFQCIIFFPNNKQLPNTLFDDIQNHIIYHIDITLDNLTTNFHNNFIQLLYYDERWCKNGGYKGKAKPCFQEGKNLKVYFTKKQDLNTLVNYKQKVRNYYNTGKHSIHIPDTQEECNSLLGLLNNNTISFMNKAPSLYINFKNFTVLFEKLKKFCKENSIDTNKITITSSSVLSVYGIRDCGDMDLFIDKKYVDIFQNTPFDNHNKYTIDKHYSKHFEDIIYNPDNHFYFQGIKFCNLSIILDYKKYRVQNKLYGKKSIEKDIKDVECIEQLI